MTSKEILLIKLKDFDGASKILANKNMFTINHK